MGKKIALSIEQMKHLESLGLDTSDASMYWFKDDDFEQLMIFNRTDILDKIDNYTRIPAYTLQDILTIIPKWITTDNIDYELEMIPFTEKSFEFHYWDINSDKYLCKCWGEDILSSAYQMLLWCIENNYIKTNKE